MKSLQCPVCGEKCSWQKTTLVMPRKRRDGTIEKRQSYCHGTCWWVFSPDNCIEIVSNLTLWQRIKRHGFKARIF